MLLQGVFFKNTRIKVKPRVRTRARIEMYKIKSAITLNESGAKMIGVADSININNVRNHCHTLTAFYLGYVPITVETPLHNEFWLENLSDCPDLDLKKIKFKRVYNILTMKLKLMLVPLHFT